MTPPNDVEVYVEELVLRGFASRDRGRIGEAVKRELARLINEEGVPPALRQGGEIPRVGTRSFEMKPDSRADAIGAQVANSVYRGLNR
jgi:hypothetical protein